MTLYLYRAGTAVPVLTLENVVSYTADSVTCADGTIYAPLAADCELSDTADCAGTLRAAWRNPTKTLESVKAESVAESKALLATYLTAHPLVWTDGNTYSVTEEKQSLLTSQLALAQVAAAAGAPYILKWNTTGGVCTEWTYANLAALALAIGAYVQPLVSVQQAYEVAVMACETDEAVDAVVLDYEGSGNGAG